MKIAIIGGGVAGLCSLKHALKDGHECTLFEQNDQIGGTWIYSDFVDKDEHGREVFTSMYKGLCTNLPKETMELEDFPYPKNMKKSYMSSEEFLNYVQKYAKKFNLHSHISYSFPFLSEDCQINVKNNYWVQYLYKHIVNINYPSMVFIGVAFRLCLIPMLDIQARYALATFKNPNLLPSREEMLTEILEERKAKDKLGYPLKWTHMIEPKHREYLQDLADSAKIKRIPDIVHSIYELSRADGFNGNRNLFFEIVDDHFLVKDLEISDKCIYNSKLQSKKVIPNLD